MAENETVDSKEAIKAADLFVHKNVAALNNRVCCKYHPEGILIDDESTASMICAECGLVVVEQMISEEAEWRNFADDSREEGWARSRVGAATNRFLSSEGNLQTYISATDKMGEYGQTIIHTQKRRTVDKAITNAFRLIEEMSDRINLPQVVIERAQYLYHKVYESRRLKGNIVENDAKTTACLFLACHEENCPRTAKEIGAISEISARLINKAARQIRKELNLTTTIVDSKEMVPRFCSQLYLPLGVRKRASQIAEVAKSMNNMQRIFPETVAAASIYIASAQSPLEKRTQKAIGQSVGLSSGAISHASRLLTNRLNEISSWITVRVRKISDFLLLSLVNYPLFVENNDYLIIIEIWR